MLSALIALLLIGDTRLAWGQQDADLSDQPRHQPRLLAHFMPWYIAPPIRSEWGWHWTMNHFQPDETANGKRPIASQYYPLSGPYDSSDPAILEYQLLLMKLGGIDGVIVDWYGLADFRDYSLLHQNTQALVAQAERLGLQFAICYEDQTIPALTEAGRVPQRAQASHAQQEIRWLQDEWFASDAYVRIDGQPVLLSFGQSGLSNEQWSAALRPFREELLYFSQQIQRDAAAGTFDWPLPQEGLAAQERFLREARQGGQVIPVAFPRFHDIYAEAKLHASYGHIRDRQGETLKETLASAWEANPSLIQIATWNDWGEGTQIEPSVEYGYRDLEIIQTFRQSRDASFRQRGCKPHHLRLPMRLLQLRRASPGSNSEMFDDVAQAIAQGKLEQAQQMLNRLESR